MRFESDKIGLFGKVPWRDEYVRLQMQAEPVTSFDRWLTDSVEWASAHAGEGWPQAYRSGGIHAFVYRPSGNSKNIVVGAISPSADGAGRSFPLAVAAPAAQSDLSSAPEVLPLLLEEFWKVASQLLVDLRTSTGPNLGERLASLQVESSLDLADARSSYQEWVQSLTMTELFSLVYGTDGAPAASIAIRMVAEAVRPYRSVDQPATPLTLRLPLGIAGGASVCFWIDLVKRAIHWKTTVPSFFWSHDGRSGTMLLHLGDAPRSTVAELWMPTDARDEFCDLSGPIRPEQIQSVRELPAPIASLWAGTDHTVHDLLQAVATEL